MLAQPAAKKFCHNCGEALLPPGAKFCASCGTATAAPPDEDPVPAPPVADPKPAGGVKGWGGLRRALPDLIPQVAPADVSSGGGIAGAPVDPNRPSHVANLSPDASLRELLIEAFKIAEIRFKNFDKDDAGALMFREVKRDISNAGFYDEQKLVEIWRRCDIDKSDMIDFSEFLYMLYMWQYANEIGTSSTGVPGGYASAYVQAKKTDLYSAFFKFKTNREIVFKGFSKMENLYMQYDTDGNRKFSESELRTFMENHLPFVFRAAATQKLIRDFYPSNRPNHEIYFHEFLGLIYLCCVEYAPDRLQGTYKSQCMPSARADDRFSISNLRMAYRALEADFKSFDADGNGRLELHEVCEGIRTNMGADQKVNFFARLEFQFNMTDLDKTGDLDFYQFCLLAFHTCSDGSYTTLIINATNGRIVKTAMLGLNQLIAHFGKGTHRFTWQQAEGFLKAIYRREGGIPPNARGYWEGLKYRSSSVNADVVDTPRMLMIIYRLAVPDGDFHPEKYKPPLRAKLDPSAMLVSLEKGTTHTEDQELVIDPVDPKKVVKGKQLGQGGQGVAYFATYEGVKVCAKFLLGKITPQVVKELLMEVALCKKLTHPNCHHLVGAKTTPPDIVLLTALCENGSIFDYYTKKLMPSRRRFDQKTAFRLSIEIAKGLQFMHSIGYMHRDVKSLNVFLDGDMVAKVADFGFATSEKNASDVAGTIQWMAQEVLYNVMGRRVVYDKRCDIYSYGVVVWELFHCQIPYATTGLDQMSLAHMVLSGRLRMAPSQGLCPPDVGRLIQGCCHPDMNKRPNFDRILQDLTTWSQRV